MLWEMYLRGQNSKASNRKLMGIWLSNARGDSQLKISCELIIKEKKTKQKKIKKTIQHYGQFSEITISQNLMYL